jgi:hypothetical protein
MHAADDPATVLIAATLPTTPVRSGRVVLSTERPDRVPVTWIAPWDRLADIVGPLPAGDDLVLELPAATLEDRQRLRTLLARGREAVPSLSAVAVRGRRPLEHRGVLVEEGIRVALVETLGDSDRGSRRPAPRGWRCRNAAWGLWEVEIAAPAPRGWRAMLGRGGRPWLRRQSLHVLRTEGLTVGNAGDLFPATRLARLVSWAGRQADRGRARAVTLTQLAGLLAGGEQAAHGRSVLRAA